MSFHLFDDDGYIGYDLRLGSQRFELYSNFDIDSVRDSVADSPSMFNNQSYGIGDDVFVSQLFSEAHFPSSIYGSDSGYSTFSPKQSGKETFTFG